MYDFLLKNHDKHVVALHKDVYTPWALPPLHKMPVIKALWSVWQWVRWDARVSWEIYMDADYKEAD